MNSSQLMAAIKDSSRPFKEMRLQPGDPGPLPVTKIGGIPWWPHGTKRPVCVDGHEMDFIVQIRLDEVPGLDQPPTLLSFHYCQQCSFEGKMAFGWSDAGNQRRYRVSLFSDLDRQIDGEGLVAESSVIAQSVEMIQGVDAMNLEDVWKQHGDVKMPDGALDLNHDVTKVGGWPSWFQQPERPEDEMGDDMQFVAQLMGPDFDGCTWNCGAAYLFASRYEEDEQQAEFVLQST